VRDLLPLVALGVLAHKRLKNAGDADRERVHPRDDQHVGEADSDDLRVRALVPHVHHIDLELALRETHTYECWAGDVRHADERGPAVELNQCLVDPLVRLELTTCFRVLGGLR
jgi:hypothetical protein